MNVKRYAYIALILLVILSVSAVSAADDQANDIISADDNDEIILDETIDEDVSSANNNYDDELILEETEEPALDSANEEKTLKDESTTRTFADLYNDIMGNEDPVINLTHNYTFIDGDEDYTNGIYINRDVTIDGQGHTIDAKGHARFFYVIADNVIIKNITFVNGNCGFHGGAIYWHRATGAISGCVFINNTANYERTDSGGAIYITNDENITIFDCIFINNTANWYGGGININKGYTNISLCVFEGNTAEKGGAILDERWRERTADSCIYKTSSDTTFNIINNPPILTVDNFTTLYNSGEKLSFDLRTNGGFAIDNGNISISVYYKNNDSWVGNYSCLSGEDWTVNLPVGSYYAIFNTEYSEFTPINRTISIKYNPNLSLEDQEVTYNGTTTISIDYNDSATGKVNVKLQGESNYTFTDLDLNSIISLGDINSGEYAVTVEYLGNEEFINSSATATLKVNKIKTDITTTNPTMNLFVGDSSKVEYTLNPADAVGDITFTSSNPDVVTVDSTGTIKAISEGTATITISLSSINYEASDATVELEVSKKATTLTASAVTTSYNINKDLVITLKDNEGNPLSDFTVSVDLNGATDYTTDSNGEIKVATKGLNAGTYTAKISFAGNENYTESSTTAKVTVNKDFTKLSASAVTTTYNVAKNLVITLKDSAGKALSGMQIVAKLGSTTKKAKTDKNGQAKINVAKLVPKTYTAKISFAGDKNYKAASTTAKVTVKKINTKIAAKAKTFKYEDKTKKYTITLKDNKNKVLKNKKVTLKVNGKTYTAKTNSKGVATFKLNKLTKKGKFTAAITYAGDKYYNKANKKAKVTVKAPAKKKSTWKTVAKGSKDKTTVKKIQQALKDNGYYLSYKGHYLKIDGIYKGHTERSVKEFQKDKGLKVTGKVDEKTAKKLKLI